MTERGLLRHRRPDLRRDLDAALPQAARLGDKNQEHCIVYNMMRLADYLLRWTGDVAYADYWERNLYNGILAQQCGPEPEYEESLSMFQRPQLPRA